VSRQRRIDWRGAHQTNVDPPRSFFVRHYSSGRLGVLKYVTRGVLLNAYHFRSVCISGVQLMLRPTSWEEPDQ